MKYYPMPTVITQADAVILANGSFPEHKIPLNILHNSNFLICCDGAINKLINTDKLPHAIIGDCDSLNEENKIRFKDIIFRDSDQETNDLTKAIKYCIKREYKKLIILGATGQREDHTLANISLLVEYMRSDLEVQMITDYGVFNPIYCSSEFESYDGQQVSIFSFSQDILSTKRLKYPVTDRNFTNWWQGTLNESESDTFSIETNGDLILFRTF